MKFIFSTQSELLKTKRTASFWLTIIGAALIPLIFFLNLTIDPGDAVIRLAADPWKRMLGMGGQALAVLVVPYIILISVLIPQIEFKNNTWKQVFASPQKVSTIFFSKFLTIHIMILACFILFNVLLIISGVLVNLVDPAFTFLRRGIDWETLLKLNLKMYVSILGVSALQYWMSLRFKNFVAPVGIGLVLFIGAQVAFNYNWAYIHQYPYAFPFLSYDDTVKPGTSFFAIHEWYSIGYFILFLMIGFLDMRMRKEKG